MRGTRLQILERRKTMLYYRRHGVKPKDFIEIISKKSGFSVSTIKKDWDNRKNWMGLLFKEKAFKSLVLDSFYDLEIAYANAYKVFDQAAVNMKVQAFSSVLKVMQMKMSFLKDLGVMDRLKREVEAKEERRKKAREEKKRSKNKVDQTISKDFGEIIDEAIDLDTIAYISQKSELKKLDRKGI